MSTRRVPLTDRVLRGLHTLRCYGECDLPQADDISYDPKSVEDVRAASRWLDDAMARKRAKRAAK